MRLFNLFILCCMLLGVGCSTPPSVSPGTVAKERARQEVDRLNARVVVVYQKRQEALARVHEIQTRLRHPGLSPKERANYLVDLDEVNRQVTNFSDHAAELEEELRQEWATYRTRYNMGPWLAGPLPK